MSVLASRRPTPSLFDDAARRDRTPQAPLKRVRGAGCSPSDGGRVTLEHRVQSVWEALLATGVADCPLCGAQMEMPGSTGRCGGCGARLT